MKKLVAFAAIIAAVSFASCGNKSAEKASDAGAAIEEAIPAAEEVVEEDVIVLVPDSTAEADSTAEPAKEEPAKPAE